MKVKDNIKHYTYNLLLDDERIQEQVYGLTGLDIFKEQKSKFLNAKSAHQAELLPPLKATIILIDLFYLISTYNNILL